VTAQAAHSAEAFLTDTNARTHGVEVHIHSTTQPSTHYPAVPWVQSHSRTLPRTDAAIEVSHHRTYTAASMVIWKSPHPDLDSMFTRSLARRNTNRLIDSSPYRYHDLAMGLRRPWLFPSVQTIEAAATRCIRQREYRRAP